MFQFQTTKSESFESHYLHSSSVLPGFAHKKEKEDIYFISF